MSMELDARTAWQTVSRCASASHRPRQAPCTSGVRGRHCTTGCSPAATAGSSLLRIEDTDRERSTPENVEQIFDALRWLELDHDEEPVFQSQRADRHAEVVQQLIDDGRAYRSTAGRDEIEAWHEEHGNRGFRGEDEGEGAVRLRVADEGTTVVRDVIRGESAFENALQDDLVIARADGTPIYHLAVVVDDLDMGITHVVRGADHYSNTPKQMLILQAMGEEAPLYAHVPLLHGPDGKKLSKRHGAASVQELRDRGYLPEAVRNYVALLGWGTEESQEFFTTDELVSEFSLERVSKSPGGVRRAEAAPHERPLPARAAARRPDGPPGGPDRAAKGCAARPRSRRRRSPRCPISGRSPAFSSTGRPMIRPRARRRWARRRRSSGSSRRAFGARRGARAVERRSAGNRAAERVGALGGEAAAGLPADPRGARRNHRLTRASSRR